MSVYASDSLLMTVTVIKSLSSLLIFYQFDLWAPETETGF
jgi:hypothetical protein